MKRTQKGLVLPPPMATVALQDHRARQLGLVPNTMIGRARPRGRAREPGTQIGRPVEYVLDAPPPPTMAQRLGLVHAPPSALSEDDWESVKKQSRERGDSLLPCPVCQEEFGTRHQVLLSCSHVFHKAFERFSGKKFCPLCRTHNYQTRVIFDGAGVYRQRAASRIQAAWRGYQVRKWYRTYRETHPPTQPVLRKRYYQKKLSNLTSRFVGCTDSTSQRADELLATVDQSMAASRSVMSWLDCVAQDDTVWQVAQEKAQTHIGSDCGVCLFPLAPPQSVFVLSCSHLFHTKCLSSLEKYSLMPYYLCPICRSPYQRKKFSF